MVVLLVVLVGRAGHGVVGDGWMVAVIGGGGGGAGGGRLFLTPQ